MPSWVAWEKPPPFSGLLIFLIPRNIWINKRIKLELSKSPDPLGLGLQ